MQTIRTRALWSGAKTGSAMASLAAVSIMLLTAAPATAAAPQQTVSRSVPYIDLNLSTAAGAERLQMRIARAAKRACASHGVPTAAGHLASRRCALAAVADAKLRVREAAVQQRNGRLAAIGN